MNNLIGSEYCHQDWTEPYREVFRDVTEYEFEILREIFFDTIFNIEPCTELLEQHHVSGTYANSQRAELARYKINVDECVRKELVQAFRSHVRDIVFKVLESACVESVYCFLQGPENGITVKIGRIHFVREEVNDCVRLRLLLPMEVSAVGSAYIKKTFTGAFDSFLHSTYKD